MYPCRAVAVCCVYVAARDTNKKYADDFGYSAEHKWIIWGLFKVVMYFAVLVGKPTRASSS